MKSRRFIIGALIFWTIVEVFLYFDEDKYTALCVEPVQASKIHLEIRSLDQQTVNDRSLDQFDSALLDAKPPALKARVAILYKGYALEMKDLLASFGEAADLIKTEELGPELIDQYPIMMIPTAALANLTYVEDLRDKLIEYVESGGLLVVMSQPADGCYRLLPGQFDCVGYERVKTRFSPSVMTSPNYAMAGQDDHIVGMLSDGIIKSWPEGSEVWLYQAEYGVPTIVAYSCGKGRVIVSSNYSDYAHGHSELPMDERAFLRDLLSWGRDFAPNLPELKPGEQLELKVPISYQACTGRLSKVKKVRLVLRSPERQRVLEEEYRVDLENGGRTLLPLLVNDLNKELSTRYGIGIWWVNYLLLNADGEVVQPETEQSRFVLTQQQFDAYKEVTPLNDLQFERLEEAFGSTRINQKLKVNASLDRFSYQKGDTAVFDVHIEKPNPQVTLPLIARVKLGDFDQIKEVWLFDTENLTFRIPVGNFQQKILFALYDAKTGRTLFKDVYNIYETNPDLNVLLDKQRCFAGDTIHVTIDMGEKKDWVALSGPGDFHSFEKIAGIKTYAIPVPESLSTDTYSIWVAYNEKTLKYKVDVIGYELRFSTGTFEPKDVMRQQPFDFSAKLFANRNVNCRLVLEWIHPDQTVTVLYSEEVTFFNGDNLIAFQGIAIDTVQPGIHYLRIKIQTGNLVLSKSSYPFRVDSEGG